MTFYLKLFIIIIKLPPLGGFSFQWPIKGGWPRRPVKGRRQTGTIGDRLTVGQLVLVQSMGVRFPLPELIKQKKRQRTVASFVLCARGDRRFEFRLPNILDPNKLSPLMVKNYRNKLRGEIPSPRAKIKNSLFRGFLFFYSPSIKEAIKQFKDNRC